MTIGEIVIAVMLGLLLSTQIVELQELKGKLNDLGHKLEKAKEENLELKEVIEQCQKEINFKQGVIKELLIYKEKYEEMCADAFAQGLNEQE